MIQSNMLRVPSTSLLMRQTTCRTYSKHIVPISTQPIPKLSKTNPKLRFIVQMTCCNSLTTCAPRNRLGYDIADASHESCLHIRLPQKKLLRSKHNLWPRIYIQHKPWSIQLRESCIQVSLTFNRLRIRVTRVKWLVFVTIDNFAST